jgi:uncharacterized membrane protein YfcA
VVVAAPFVIWAKPELMPGSMLLCGFIMPLTQLAFFWRDIDWRSFRPAIVGRLLLTPVGVWVVAASSPRLIALMVGVLVLVVAVASAYAPAFEAKPRNLFVAGMLTGISGTSAAVGGPFVAMTLQHEDALRIRATLAAFFTAGSVASILGLVISGEMTEVQLTWGAIFMPFLLAGALLAGPIARRLDGGRLRLVMLVFCVLSGVSIILRAALG